MVQTKAEALDLREQFRAKLASMGLQFSHTSILPASRGVNFLGYRIWSHKRLLRKDSIRRIKRNLKHMQWQYRRGQIGMDKVGQRVNSWLAHAGHADTDNLKRQLLGSDVFTKAPDSASELDIADDVPISK